jgi:hypothetical protein
MQQKVQKEITYYCLNGPSAGESGKLTLLPDSSVVRFPYSKSSGSLHIGCVYYKIGETVNGYTNLYHIETFSLWDGQQN